MIIVEKIKRNLVRKLYKVLKPYVLKDFLIKEKSDFYVHKNDFNSPHILLGQRVLIDSTSVFKTLNKTDRIEIGDNTSIGHGVCLISFGGTIKIGKDCDINPYSIIYGHGKGVVIGDRVLIAGHCMIIPNNHVFENPDFPIINQGNISKGIVIGNDVWIGHGCSILDGVVIGNGCVIGAGTVVTKSLPDNSICVGSSGKVIKNR